MAEILRLWLHLLGAAVWVGSQVFVFVVMVPILRSLQERELRLRVLRIMTGRFGWLGWLALATQVGTGIWLLLSLDFDYEDLRYGIVLNAKLGLVGLAVLLTAYHTLYLGPRIMAIYNAAGEGALTPEAELRLRRLRAASGAVSGLNLLVALLILFAAATLPSAWAHRPA